MKLRFPPQGWFKFISLAALSCLLIVAIACSEIYPAPQPSPPSDRVNSFNNLSEPIPKSFFGMHIENLDKTPWPAIPFASWRVHDSLKNGRLAFWAHLEPEKNKWDFKTLDAAVELAQQKGVELIYVMSMTPKWAAARPQDGGAYGDGPTISEPKNIEDWKNYIRTVGTRYKGKIRYYELWNEANLKNWFSGSIDQLVEMSREAYTILKNIDPKITVISPSIFADYGGVVWLDEYLQKGGKNYLDVIGAHFYISKDDIPEEKMLSLITQVKEIQNKHQLGDKPLWNTETGYGSKQQNIFLSDEESMSYIARSYIINWWAGVKRFYWYGWDTANVVTLLMVKEDKQTLTSAAQAYSEVQKWLVGSQLDSCQAERNGIWNCLLIESKGTKARIVWHPRQKITFQVPSSWQVKQIKELSGKTNSLPPSKQIEVGKLPVLLAA